MVTAATPRLERDWLEQLCLGGMLLAPLTIAPGLAFVIRGSVADGVFTGRLMRAAYFMPLRAEGESGNSDDESAFTEHLHSVPAPWADWLQRRRGRGNWLRLGQSLAFYALLRGLTTSYHGQSDGQPLFGISDGTHTCWLSPSHWYVTDHATQHLGDALWRSWLDTGGPWPTEFEVRLPLDPACVLAAADDEYVRDADGGRQVWRLIERRERGTWI